MYISHENVISLLCNPLKFGTLYYNIIYYKPHTQTQGFKNTLIYTQLLPFNEDEQFICKVAENTKEACQLIEDGWEYVTGEYGDGGKIFRKPK